jgi:hypothetical protein
MIHQNASVLPLQAQDNRRGGVRLSLVLALSAGLLACLLAASYLARTPLVIGPLVQQKLSLLAERHDVNLTVNTFRPVGFTGLRLEQVQLVTRRGSYLIEADLDAVDITPSLGELFSGRHIHPASVEVDGGRIQITRAPVADTSPPDANPPPPDAESDTQASSEPTSGQNSGAAASPPRPVSKRLTRAILHDVSVSVRPAPLPGTTRPLVLHRAELVVATAGEPGVSLESIYGELPDATPFSVRQLPGDGPGTYIVEPEVPTRVDRWFDTPTPASMSVESVILCPECDPARVELTELRFSSPSGRTAHADTLELLASANEVRVGFSEISLADAKRELPYRLLDLEAVYDAQSQTTIFQGEVRDDESGSASFASSWSGQWGVLETDIQLDSFDTDEMWTQLGVSQQIDGGVHTGTVEASYEPRMDLVEFSIEIDSRDLTLDLPVVTDAPLDFERVGLTLDASLQPRARTLSVSTGEARLGQKREPNREAQPDLQVEPAHTEPIRFGGYAIDAGRGWVFETYTFAEAIHPQRLRDGLPPTIARLARGTEFGGEFGFDIRSAGHTGYPESIALSVDFSGQVEVRGDSSFADVLALAAAGPPSIDLPGTLAQNVPLDAWIAYDSLPAHVPQVLTAAEDAKFFSHDGFDWRGLRRALVHNVKAGGIKRGGSTLSQQLSKNLFLDHERTLARKLQEAYVTWRLESELSKERILELYMNLVEWGPNIQGLRQAADRYFGVAPEDLTIPQVALLASVLPGPSLFGQQVLSGYLPSSRVEKIEHILSNLRFLHVISSAEYRDMYARAIGGEIGGLDLKVCDDDGKSADITPKCP